MKKSFQYVFFFMLLSIGLSSCEKKVELVKIKTSYGDILVYLYDATPKHKANFLKLTKEKFYDGTTFHRIIRGFVIQGGDPNSKDTDPNNDGQGGPGYTIDAEINPAIKHKYGALGAARDNNPEKKSNGSQFYISMDKNGLKMLDGAYTVFGEVVAGMDIAEKIAEIGTDGANNRPLTEIKMSVEIVQVSPSELSKKYGFKMPDLQAK
jgi:cyclophilin family peptidyl-prolyl cis-trans isomerase